ncbi:putative F-box protein At5g55150 [Carica papaya]|uniref:putative F-box protein At5g55150 n=1 Tax=Carica papaya TaxID=3649 RepID=UPI000B8D07BA|nr:putative F-box protein At5g55150 [Carica papaya]
MAAPSELHSWSDLPQELLELIFTSTKYPADIIRCSAVCLSWHSVASTLYRKVFPLFILQTGEKEPYYGGRTLFNISPHGNRKINLPEELSPEGTANKPFYYFGASNGWLLTVGSIPPFEIHLLNPFSGFRILLPTLYPNFPPSLLRIPKEWTITGVKVSSCPSRPLCFIVVTFFFGLRGVICRAGDTQWKDIDRRCFEDLMIYNDRLYSLGPMIAADNIFSCEINNDSENPGNITCEQWRNRPIPRSTNPAILYIVKSLSGEFWLVRKSFHDGSNGERIGIESFQVFKLDLEKNKWTRVYDLGSQALVITETPHCAAALAGGTSATSFRSNCIYYVNQRPQRSRSDVEKYDVESKRGPFYLGRYDVETMHTDWFDPQSPAQIFFSISN